MTYIKVDPCSTRLGNWMFQYAAAKKASKEPCTFVIDGNQDIEAVRRYRRLWPEVEYARSAPEGAELRLGLFQDQRFVDRDESRRLFAAPAQMPESATVSIHVRRGDYLRQPHRHPFVGKRYLTEAVARFPGEAFSVFSDDLKWCRKFFTARRFPGVRFEFMEGNSALDDLFLMGKCTRGHICSNSSFSWWGAYLGKDAPVIFPSHWFGLAIKADWTGLYFEGSEVIANRYTPLEYFRSLGCLIKNLLGRYCRLIKKRIAPDLRILV